MISPETVLFSQIANGLRAKYRGILVSGSALEAPARFPVVTILEADNRVYGKMRTTTIEHAASLLYEVNIYSNKTGRKKSEAKMILDTIDREFSALGFTRTMCSQAPNLQDGAIFRMVARYEGVAVLEPDGAEETIRIYTK